jgi:hypothetical protein
MTISRGPLSCVIPGPRLSPLSLMISITLGLVAPWILYRLQYSGLMKLPAAPESIITIVSRSMMLAVILMCRPYAIATRCCCSVFILRFLYQSPAYSSF